MAILRVARMGNPVLRQVAEPIQPEGLADDEVQILIDDMLDTIEDYQGAGLAAPQVHDSRRIVIFCPPVEDDDEEDPPEPLVLVNPTVSPLDEARETGWEGCLSIPDLRGEVLRYTHVAVTALDRSGKAMKFRAQGHSARIIQHEVDHLDGALYLDRMPDLKSLCFLSEYGRHSEEST